MPEQILIELVTDDSQLISTIQRLEALGAIDKNAAAAFAKTNAEIAKTTAATKALNAENSKSVKTYDDVHKSVDRLADATMEAIGKGVSTALKESGVTAENLTKAIGKTGKAVKDVATESTSLRGRLAAMRVELVALADAGQTGSARFRQLSIDAGELSDSIGDASARIAALASDTKYLDAGIEGIKGLASGFGLVTGAAAIFGLENEQVAASLQKIQAVSVILQSLTEIQNLLQSESTLAVLTNTGARATQAAAVGVETAAEAANATATVAATTATTAASVAMRIFNGIIKSNPIGLLITALGAVLGVFALFSKKAKESAENTKEFREELGKTSGNVFEAQNKLAVLTERVQATGKSFTEKQAILIDYNKEFGDSIGKANSYLEAEKKILNQAGPYIKMLNLKARAQAAANLSIKKSEELLQKQLEFDRNEVEANKLADVIDTYAPGSSSVELAKKRKQDLINNQLETNKEIETLRKIQVDNERAAGEISGKNHFDQEKDKTDKSKSEANKRAKLAKEEAEERKKAEAAALAEIAKLRDEHFLVEINDEVERAKAKVIQETNNEKERIATLKITADTRRQLLTALRQKEIDALSAIDKKAAIDAEQADKDSAQRRRDGALNQLERVKNFTLPTAQDQHKKELEDLELLHSRKLISERKYLELKEKLTGDSRELETFKILEQQQIEQELTKESFEILGDLTSAFFDLQSQRRKDELEQRFAALDRNKESELSAANITAQQREDIEKRYQEKQRQVKIAAAKRDREAAIQAAIVNTLLAVGNALATVKPFIPAALIAAGLAAATGAVQVAKIRATPLPGFKTGTKNAPKGYALVGEEGPEYVYLNGGEKIYKNSDTNKIMEAWRGGSQATADQILSGMIPHVNPEYIAASRNSAPAQSIDYDKLGRSIAKHVPEPVINTINMNENGFTKYIQKKGYRAKIINQRFKFKT